MNDIYHLSRMISLQGIRRCEIILILLIAFLVPGVLAAVDTWQPVEARSWVQIDIPPGWNSYSGKNETISPESSLITASAPDKKTRLTYILEHTPDTMTRDRIQKFQSEYMSKTGFRICRTKDPVIKEKSGTFSYRQTYVRGTGDAAVIGTLAQPGWGQAHFVLVMEGPQAVEEYYESLSPLVQDHIRPVAS